METEINWYLITVVIYLFTNIIFPPLAIGAAHYGTKKQFWLDVIIPFRIAIKAFIALAKLIIQNFKEHYPNLK